MLCFQVLNRLRQVLRTVVSSHLGEKSAVSYQLSENQYAANEAEDPFAHALVEYLRYVLRGNLDGLVGRLMSGWATRRASLLFSKSRRGVLYG